MPLFKRSPSDRLASKPEDRPGPTHFLESQALLDRLDEEMYRAGRYGRLLSVICAAPQVIGSGNASAEEIEAAAAAVSGRLRFCDVIGTIESGAVVAILPETGIDAARAVAQRITSDLTIVSAATARRNWRTGAAAFPADGKDPPAMVQAAMRRAEAG